MTWACGGNTDAAFFVDGGEGCLTGAGGEEPLNFGVKTDADAFKVVPGRAGAVPGC